MVRRKPTFECLIVKDGKGVEVEALCSEYHENNYMKREIAEELGCHDDVCTASIYVKGWGMYAYAYHTLFKVSDDIEDQVIIGRRTLKVLDELWGIKIKDGRVDLGGKVFMKKVFL